MKFTFRNPFEVQFNDDYYGIKRMIAKFVVAGIVIGIAMNGNKIIRSSCVGFVYTIR